MLTRALLAVCHHSQLLPVKLLRAVPDGRSAAAARADGVSGSDSEYSRALQGTPQWAESESESDGGEDGGERVRCGSARALSRHGRAGAPPPVETAAAVVDWHMQVQPTIIAIIAMQPSMIATRCDLP